MSLWSFSLSISPSFYSSAGFDSINKSFNYYNQRNNKIHKNPSMTLPMAIKGHCWLLVAVGVLALMDVHRYHGYERKSMDINGYPDIHGYSWISMP